MSNDPDAEKKSPQINESLERSLGDVKNDLHNFNMLRMAKSTDSETGAVDRGKRTVYPDQMGRVAAYKALEDCRRIAAMVRGSNDAISRELDEDSISSFS